MDLHHIAKIAPTLQQNVTLQTSMSRIGNQGMYERHLQGISPWK